MTAQTEITQQAVQSPVQDQHDLQNLLFNHQAMRKISNLANMMASGKSTVPHHLQGNPADCMAVIMQAAQWRMNPFAVAQKTHTVKGVLGYEAQLVNAVITTMAPTTGRLQYEWYGPWENVIGKFETKTGNNGPYQVPGWKPADEQGCGVRVWATIKGEANPRVLDLLLSQAQVRNSTLWASDPKQQLAYLATKRWARLHTPDVILGVYTPDEMDGFGTAAGERDVTPKAAQPAASHQNGATGGRVASKLAARKQKANVQDQPIDQEPIAAEQPSGPTFAQIAESMHKAEDLNQLDEIASMIGNHLPEDQVDGLRKIYSENKKKLQANEQ